MKVSKLKKFNDPERLSHPESSRGVSEYRPR